MKEDWEGKHTELESELISMKRQIDMLRDRVKAPSLTVEIAKVAREFSINTGLDVSEESNYDQLDASHILKQCRVRYRELRNLFEKCSRKMV